MKRFIIRLFPLAVLLCLYSCNENRIDASEEPEYITMRFGFDGDQSSTDTKASSDGNLYGINVLYDSKKDGNIDTRYAYGLFDNKQDMVIQLLSGYKYEFRCTLVKNGKNTLYYGQYGGNTYPGYANPFQTNTASSTALTNSFVYGSSTYLSGIRSGDAIIKTTGGYVEQSIPSIERYYGEVTGYAPVVGGIVTIPLKRTVFGVRFMIGSVPEGTLGASCTLSSPASTIWQASTGNNVYDSGAIIYSFPDVYNCWKNETPLSANVGWTFTSSVFDQWNQNGTQTVSFKRNVLTTVTIGCTPDNATANLLLTEESIGENNNIYLYLNSDGIIVIGVDPDPE